MPILCVESGADKGRQIALDATRPSVVVGRIAGVDLQLTDPLVSGRHFRAVLEEGGVAVEDLSSTNGLFVNDERVLLARIAPGDVLRAGDTYISLLSDEGRTESGIRAVQRDIGGFLLQDRIGVGGMGIVYKALQRSLDRIVALKVLPPRLTKRPELVKKFLAEARAAGCLTHANVVQVHDVSEADGTYYICMEYVSGGSVADLLREAPDHRMAAERAVPILIDVARGLGYAEAQSIVHCDIKPDNIMLTEAGQAKIADLGIARRVASTDTAEKGHVFGSPHYMAPEQAQARPLDHRADLYALGCTAFRMLAGQTPFTGTTAQEIMLKQVREEAPDLRALVPEIPEALAEAVRRLMRKAPEDRYPSASDLIADLEPLRAAAARPPARASVRLTAPASVRSVAPASVRSAAPSPAPVPPPSSRKSARRTGPALPNIRTSSVFRVQRRRPTSEMPFFLPIAVAVVALGIALFLGVYQAAPDPGESAVRIAEERMSRGDYDGAILAVRNVHGRQPETARRIAELRREADLKKLEQMAARNFELLWSDYLQLKRRDAPAEERKAKLKELESQFASRPEWAARIAAELKAIP